MKKIKKKRKKNNSGKMKNEKINECRNEENLKNEIMKK